MILTLNTAELKNTLKAFFGVSSKATDQKYADLVVLRAQDGAAHIMAGSDSNFALAALTAEVEEPGLVCVSYDLYELVRAVPDESVRLSIDKNMVIQGVESKFRARLALRDQSAEYPFDKVLAVLDQGVSEFAVCRSESIKTLVNLTLRFVPDSIRMPWARLTSQEGQFYGESMPVEIGSVEHYELSDQVDGDFSVCVPVKKLNTLLTFCGTYTRIGMSIGAKGFIIVDDPEDQTWKGIIGSVVFNANQTA